MRFGCWRRPKGIFTEPAGGTTLAGTIDLVQRGVIGPDESVVVCITGNGYKTAEVVSREAERAGAAQSRVQGIRSLVGVAPGARIRRASL